MKTANKSVGIVVWIASVWGSFPAIGQAQLFYDFLQSGTGDVLATLELTGLPATHEEVAGLTFSEAGTEALLGGFAPNFMTSDPSSPVIENAPGLLGCAGCVGLESTGFGGEVVFDEPGNAPSFFSISFSNALGGDGIAFDLDGQTASAFGDWVAVVPEPSSGTMSIILALLGGMKRNRQQRLHPFQQEGSTDASH